jgi:hypothetical protein
MTGITPEDADFPGKQKSGVEARSFHRPLFDLFAWFWEIEWRYRYQLITKFVT